VAKKGLKDRITMLSLRYGPQLRIYNAAVMTTLLLAFILAITLGGCVGAGSRTTDEAKLPVVSGSFLDFKEVAVGIYERAEYQPQYFVFSSGGGSTSGGEKKKEGGEKEQGIKGTSCTIVHFSDGRAQPLYGYITMPYPKGTKIRILQNGIYAFKIVKVEDDPKTK
jgi:hypothetical protein